MGSREGAGLAAGLAAGLLLLACGGEAAAQASGEERGWLGLGIEEVMECRVRAVPEGACRKKLVVAEVVVDGPADRAGVLPGDTLLALDGRPLEPALRARALESLRRGRAVRLRLAREGRRASLRVVPGARPAAVRSVRVRAPEGGTRVVDRAMAFRPGEPPAAPRALEIRGRGGGVFQIRPSRADGTDRARGTTLVVGPDGGARIAAVDGVELHFPYASAHGGRWRVQLDLGPELLAVQESVFRAARLRLDSLQKAVAGNERGYLALLESLRLRGSEGPAWVGPFHRSVAGAEFEPLNPGLAEFFEGAETGLLVLRVVPGTPAARLGLRPGDVVVEAGGRSVEEVERLREALFRAREGSGLDVKWIRKGEARSGVLRFE